MIDLWLGSYIIDITTYTYQQAIIAIQPFHTSYASRYVEGRKAVYFHSLALFDGHSLYSHNPL